MAPGWCLKRRRMAILSAAVVAVGCLCLFDLLLTFAVLRRLREHAGLLAHADLHVYPDGHLGLITIADELAPRIAEFLRPSA